MMDVSSDDFTRLCDDVLKAHKLEDGVTLCKDCHEEVDGLRRAGGKKKKAAVT